MLLLLLPAILISGKHVFDEFSYINRLTCSVVFACVLGSCLSVWLAVQRAVTMPPYLTAQPPMVMPFNIRSALSLTCAASGYPPPT